MEPQNREQSTALSEGASNGSNGEGKQPSSVLAPTEAPPRDRRKKPRIRETPPTPPPPPRLDDYEPLIGKAELDELRFLAQALHGKTVKMVNSTAVGGGVAEILNRLTPLLTELEVATHWDVITGGNDFFEVTKAFHNALHGGAYQLTNEAREIFLLHNEQNRARMRFDEDVIILHDPQPAALIKSKTDNHQRWIWRCHIDLSNPHPEVWGFLRPLVEQHDAAIFSSQAFARQLSIPQYLFYPCIDPLSEKNKQLDASFIQQVCDDFGIDRSRPILTQISRFDRLKDPLGVIQAYQLAKKYADCQLVLAGGSATDDPEGAVVLAEVMQAAGDDPDIIVLNLPPWSGLEINALQSASTIIIQKSLKEGFGLTVTEALWKGKPTIGSAVGGIPNQVIHKLTGALVHSVEGCAYQIRYLLTHPEFAEQLGKNGREHVKENFLITSNVKRWLLLFQIMMGIARQ
ncbi:MAG: glycosyl transferase family 1 [Acidobacteria bacterium]|nr:MAG: glycosyl transferase family 1 [Acidobacteriota bacterium]PYY08617.1 MAG: glycosyl transferase family 1 [Acidobacteriota bacterium]